jgi:transposase
MQRAVQAAPDQQISLTDPDARSMATSGKGTGIVGYNVQTAVDTKHHLIGVVCPQSQDFTLGL